MLHNPAPSYPEILKTISIIHICALIYVGLLTLFILRETIPLTFNALAYLIIPFVCVLQYKYRITAYLYKDQAFFFEQKWRPDFGEFLQGVFLPLLMLFLILTTEGEQSGLITLTCALCVMVVYENFHLLVIFPNGVIVRKGFYEWNKINTIEWNGDGEVLNIHLPSKKLDAADDVHIDWWISEERRDSLKRILSNKYHLTLDLIRSD